MMYDEPPADTQAENEKLRTQVAQLRELLELNVREHEEKDALIAQLRRGTDFAKRFNDAQKVSK